MKQELLLTFMLEWPTLSLAQQVNAILAVVSLVGLIHVVRHSWATAMRPAFLVALLAHITYQWPAVLFTPVLTRGLGGSVLFFAAVHAAVLCPLAWLRATRSWSDDLARETHAAQGARRYAGSVDNFQVDLPRSLTLASVATLIAFAAFYVFRIDARCTAMFAMVFDPRAGLLARETAGKLFAGPIEAYALGLVINVLAPLVQFIAVHRIEAAWRSRRWSRVAAWTMVSVAAVLIVLVPGAKGNLLVSGVAIGAALLTGRGSLSAKVLKTACAGFAIFIGLSLVEKTFERGAGELASGCYPVGGCAVRHNACAPTRALVGSLWARDEALGMTRTRMVLLERDMEAACSPTGAMKSVSMMCTPSARATVENLASAAREVQSRAVPQPAELALHVPTPPTALDRFIAGHRSLEIASGVLRRAMVVPLQVASWHHRYRDDYGAPGLRALPVVNHLAGGRLIMPIEVYRVYYAVYSAGDRTATGTTPTSFLIGYPAYLGIAGLVLAGGLLILFDGAATLALRELPRAMRLFGAALLAVTSVNFMASDFSTSLVSHGGAASLLLLCVFALVQRQSRIAR